jgi:primosomal protein N' (replication factor Y)
VLFNTNLIFRLQKPYNAIMWYVEVLVAESSFHKDEPLTYSAEVQLPKGSIVTVPLRSKEVMGVVVATVPKPRFAAKPILNVPALPLLPAPLLDLLEWMRSYYPAPLGVTMQLFLPKELPKKPLPPIAPSSPPEPDLPPLTTDQQNALKEIKAPGMHLLHGETGSGKTRVYIELAKRALVAGKSALILTPEIGLTSQLSDDLRRVFGDRVVLVHSGLTEVARRQTWQQILQKTQPLVIVGARSALFSPLDDLGLIIVDEAHETAYKQDQAPYYHATPVAAKLAGLQNATVVLGSATPLVSDYFVASVKQRPIIRMTQLAASSENLERRLHIVDLKDRSLFSKSSHLSAQLLESMHQTLNRREQVLLFLNRRGTARVVFCEACGWQATCPHCDLPLVYHGDHHIMRCHSCDYRAASPSSCPECKHAGIVFRSIGTKAIHEEVTRLFPGLRVMRFDTDNKKSERLEINYDDVRSGKVDVLIGTQTLAKGLDLPNLGLVGVLIADTSLYFPDYSAEERTYQLLSQVLGRIGRGHRQGEAVIQTYAPDSPLLQAILTKDWGTFYNKELKERQQFLFPPFCYTLKLTCRRASSASAEKTAEAFATELRRLKPQLVIEGPVPSFREKVQGKFAWQLIIKAKRRAHLTDIIKQLPSGWAYDIDPTNLL